MYNDLIDDIQKQIKVLKDGLEAACALPDLSHSRASFCATTNCILVTCPYAPSLFEQNRATLESAGWKFAESYFVTDAGKLVHNFQRDGMEINLYYDPKMGGSACKINLVGYEQRPVYEIACLDAEPLT